VATIIAELESLHQVVMLKPADRRTIVTPNQPRSNQPST
jgi:hypothetical protein